MLVAAALVGAGAGAAELEFSGRGASSCAALKCPAGINCDAFVKPACERCVAGAGNRFVIRCADASCSSFAGMDCVSPPADCSEAKQNVDWVLVKDGPALNTYFSARRAGESPFEALLTAQGHNPNAQASIRRCRAWVEEYLASAHPGKLEPPAGRPAAQGRPGTGAAEPFDLDCISVVDAVPGYAGDGGLWYVDLYTENRCPVRVSGKFCVAFGGQERLTTGLAFFRPGVSQTVRVHDPRLLHETQEDKHWRYITATICTRDAPFRCHGSCN